MRVAKSVLSALLISGCSGPELESWLDCDGYLTRNATERFCEQAPPDDWRPRDFDGERYYFIPLGA
jgi:hypothetical protein